MNTDVDVVVVLVDTQFALVTGTYVFIVNIDLNNSIFAHFKLFF